MLRRRKKPARQLKSEIHSDRCDDRAAVESEMLKRALARIKNNKRAVRNIRAKLIADGLHPLDREEAENVVSVFFERESDSWIRAVGWLHGQSYAASQYYYKKELPQLIEAEEAAADESGGGIDVDAIIAAELGTNPDLTI